MDPLSHAALGYTLASMSTASPRKRALLVAGTMGALSPDIDAVFMPFGWDRYLVVHEIGTHSLAGTLACAVLTAAVVRPWARGVPQGTVIRIAWLGAISHVLLDLLSSARLRWFWPFVDLPLSVPLVAMADPWLAALLIGSAIAAWAAPGGRTAPLILALATAFLGAKGLLAVRAVNAYERAQAAGTPGTGRVVEAEWASATQWHVFDRTDRALRAWRADAREGAADLVMEWPAGRDHSNVTRSRTLPVVRNFLRVHGLAFAVTAERGTGRDLVLWSDIRFCWDPSRPGARQVEPTIAGREGSIACALWFGGEFDAGGAPTRQVVQIGRFRQYRKPDD